MIILYFKGEYWLKKKSRWSGYSEKRGKIELIKRVKIKIRKEKMWWGELSMNYTKMKLNSDEVVVGWALW